MARGTDVKSAIDSGRLTLLDAAETLSSFCVDGSPDWDRFRTKIGGLIEQKRVETGGARVRAYGEMVDLLWKDGRQRQAINLEEMWNDLGRLHQFTLLCAYVMGNFFKEADGAHFEEICKIHTHVVPTERYANGDGADDRLREVTFLQQRALALENEVAQRKELEKALRETLAERRRVEAELRYSQQELVDFFENAAEGLHWVGPDGTILWANRAELEMLGYSKEEYVGRNIAEFHVDEDVISDILGRLCRGETIQEYESRLRCKDGSIRHVVIHSNVYFRDGKFVHTRCFTRDVTERKRLEQELRHQNEELSRALHMSEMFVGILGHDLRNPLSAIMTGAGLLARRADSDKIAKPAHRILNTAERMGRMIDQILDFSRIRLGGGLPLQRRHIDLAEVCRLVIDETQSSEGDHPVRLEEVGDAIGVWDGDRLSQMVSNLLDNALAHGSTGAPVAIRVDGSGAEELTLEIHNAGVIAPEILPVLFDAFRSAKKKQERSSGLGLGLFITKQIVLAHGGAIEVTSTAEDGTRFVIRLPRSAPIGARSFDGGSKTT
jgi:PAS domain S-box-containing protein